MIKRNYFMKVKKPYGDGTGSYSYQTLTFYRRSWLSEPYFAYKDAFKEAEKLLELEPGISIEVCAFNRI